MTDELITNPNVDLVTFTGGVAAGKYIAGKAGYRRIVLELGGNDPLIVMEDADLDEASTLAVQGSYKNSGQRCTAVKRMLVHESVAQRFVDLVVDKVDTFYGKSHILNAVSLDVHEHGNTAIRSIRRWTWAP